MQKRPTLTNFRITYVRLEISVMKIISRTVVTATILSAALLASGCSDTWQGVKEDTSKNLDKAGDVVIKAGEKLKSE